MPSLRLNAVANGPNFADLSASLSGAIARLRDLLRIVRSVVYLREFSFSNSIKSHAPALAFAARSSSTFGETNEEFRSL